jgi:hypothetical protein
MGIFNVINHNNLIIDDSFLYHSKKNTNEIPCGYIVDDSLVLLNGDSGIKNVFVDSEYKEDAKFITISFKCLARFFNDGKEPNKADMIKAIGSVDVIDSTEDESVTQALWPGFGFVKLWGNNWHRSASILFQSIEHPNEYILMGVDEDQYFGCMFNIDNENVELVDSLELAYKMLMPKHIRETPSSNIRRQGEWFFIKLDGDVNAYVGAEKTPFNCREIKLQHILKGKNDSLESNLHVVMTQELWFVNDTFKINSGNKIPVFYNAYVYHNQHQELELDGFWWPIENTAIQSFSEEGVD